MKNTASKSSLRSRFFGDKAFYLMVLGLAVPVMVQNGITNFVGMLDNIMIGRVGTEQMSGAAIANQLIFVYNLCLFGGISGAGIFTAQFFGQKNAEGVRQTVRFKLWLCLILTIIAGVLFWFFGDRLITLYLQGDGSQAEAAATLAYGRQYLRIMLAGLIPFMLTMVYAGTLRECSETLIPMKAGIAAVLVNLVFNYLLIYGKFGFPQMGVAGAAVATVLSRYVEALIILVWTHTHKEKNAFAEGLYSSFRVQGALAKKILVKGTPLLVNETLWGSGVAVLAQCYSVRGLNVMAAMNISNTVNNVFNIVFIALGGTVAIIVGQLLGAGKMEEAKAADTRLIVFSVLSCVGVALVMIAISPFFPLVYKTSEEVHHLATYFIIISAAFMPQNAFLHAAYFTIRSGGKTLITFFFDSGFIWVVSVPLAYCLSRFTLISVIMIYLLVQAADFLKCIVGYILIKKGIWMNNIVENT